MTTSAPLFSCPTSPVLGLQAYTTIYLLLAMISGALCMPGQHSISWATPPACAQSLGVASATRFYSTDNSGKCQTNSRLLVMMLRHHTERMMGGEAEATIRDGRGGW